MLSRNGRWPGVVIVSLILCASATSRAQTEATPAQPAASGDAKSEGDVAECAKEFEQAQEFRKTGKLSAASAAFIRCSQPICPKFIAKECTDGYSETQASLPSVVLRARGERGEELVDVAVQVDGGAARDRLDGLALPLDPGVHDFVFRIPGREPLSVRTLLAEGERNKVVWADFRKPDSAAAPETPAGTARPADASRPASPLPLYLIGGAGLLTLGGGVILRVLADNEYDDLTAECKPNCTSEQVDSVDMKYTASTTLIGVGAAALVTAGVLLIVRGASSEPPAAVKALSVEPVAGGQGATAVFRGRF